MQRVAQGPAHPPLRRLQLSTKLLPWLQLYGHSYFNLDQIKVIKDKKLNFFTSDFYHQRKFKHFVEYEFWVSFRQ